MVEDVGTQPMDHDSALIDIRTLHFLYPEIAVLCQRGGWQAITESALAALVDVKDRFTRNLAGRAARYADLAGRNEVAVPDFVVAYRDIVGADGLKDLRHYCESIPQLTLTESSLKDADFPFSSRAVPQADSRSMNTSVDSIASTVSLNGTCSSDKDASSHFDTDILWPPMGTSSEEMNSLKKADDGGKSTSTTGTSLVIRADEDDDSELQEENSVPKQAPATSLPVVAPRQLKSFVIGPDGQVMFLKEPKIASAKLPTDTSPKKAPKAIQEPIQNTVPVEQPAVKHKKNRESKKKHTLDPEDHAETPHKSGRGVALAEEIPTIADNESLKIRIKSSAKKDRSERKESSKKHMHQSFPEIKEELREHPKSVKMTFPIPPEKPKLNIKFSKHNFELPSARDELLAVPVVPAHSEKEKKSKSKRSDRDEEKELKKAIQRNKERQLEKELEMAVKTKRPSSDAPEVEAKKHKKGSSEASPAYFHSQQDSPRIVTPYHDVPVETEERSKKSHHKKRKEREYEEEPLLYSSKSKHVKVEPKEDGRSQKAYDDIPNESIRKKDRSKQESSLASVPSVSSQVPSTSAGLPVANPAIPKLKLKFGGKSLVKIDHTPVKQEAPAFQPSPQAKSPRVVLPPVQAPIATPAFALDMSRKKSTPAPEFATSAPLDLSMSSRAQPPKEVKEPKQPKETAPPVKTQPVPVKKESKRSMGSHMPSRASMVGHTKEAKVPTPPPPIPGPIAIKDVKDVLAPIITDDVPLIKVIVQEQQQDKVWICPSCKRPDDGVSEMVGCDGCDEWYHWVCVGLTSEPASDKWYCPKCLARLMAKAKKSKKK